MALVYSLPEPRAKKNTQTALTRASIIELSEVTQRVISELSKVKGIDPYTVYYIQSILGELLASDRRTRFSKYYLREALREEIVWGAHEGRVKLTRSEIELLDLQAWLEDVKASRKPKGNLVKVITEAIENAI